MRFINVLIVQYSPQIPYNMERIWYLVSDRDTELVSDLMKQFEKSNSVSLPSTLLDQIRQTITQSCVVPDQDIRESLKKVWDEDAYLLCLTPLLEFIFTTTTPRHRLKRA